MQDCGDLMSYNFFAWRNQLLDLMEGRPLFVCMPDSKFNLANFTRANLYASLEVLKVGMDILLKEEKVLMRFLDTVDSLRQKGVGQSILAAAPDTPVSVMETAMEKAGSMGNPPFASYMNNKAEDEAPDGDYLMQSICRIERGTEMDPDPKDVEGYKYIYRTLQEDARS